MNITGQISIVSPVIERSQRLEALSGRVSVHHMSLYRERYQ
ncbi:MAG: hypothetical protein AAGA75_17900 [Cyanobacteria bacterium P01_E01_bin.6]